MRNVHSILHFVLEIRLEKNGRYTDRRNQLGIEALYIYRRRISRAIICALASNISLVLQASKGINVREDHESMEFHQYMQYTISGKAIMM